MLAPPTAVRCGGTLQSGEQCRREAILGGTVCSQHGGAAKQVRERAAARIGNAADEMVKRLFAMLDDPETPHAVRSKIMQDMLDRAGLNATGKLVVGVAEVDPVEALFRAVLQDSDGLDPVSPVPYVPRPEIAALNRGADPQALGEDDDVFEAEWVEDPASEPDPHTVHVTESMSDRPPKHIREALEMLK